MTQIKCIDIGEKKVYIEHMDLDSYYVSFHQAEKLIKEMKPEMLTYSCADKEKSVNFLNMKILNRYAKLEKNRLVLKSVNNNVNISDNIL